MTATRSKVRRRAPAPPTKPRKPRAVRHNFYLPPESLARLDRLARLDKRTRSAMLRLLIDRAYASAPGSKP